MQRYFNRAVTIALAALAIVGCGRDAATPTPPAPTDASNAAIPADTRITLERTPCFGTCPSYKITISADGTVAYEGKDFVATKGAAEGKLAPGQLRELLLAFAAVDYSAYRDSYNDGGACPEFATDSPSALTSLTRDGATKQVNHYYGCRGFPGEQALTDLETKIDAIAGTSRWVGAK